MSGLVRDHEDLEVWQRAFASAIAIFDLTKPFPKIEAYALTDQIRRSSRSVTANIAEAWEKRRYEPAFIAKLIDAAAEASETKDWLQYSFACGYTSEEQVTRLRKEYEAILRTLHAMIRHASSWCSK